MLNSREMTAVLLLGIHDLRYKVRVLHRNISVSTIVHTKHGGMDKFILVDSGFSVSVDESGMPLGSPSCCHTRMLPFMAQELVADMDASSRSWRHSVHKPAQHCVRHDFESLFWVSVWCAITVVSPDEEDPGQKINGLKYLATWEMPSLRCAANRKHAIIFGGNAELNRVPLSPYFEHLREWVRAFCDCIYDGFIARRRWEKKYRNAQPSFSQYETGHGEVTREKLLEAFKSYGDDVFSSIAQGKEAAEEPEEKWGGCECDSSSESESGESDEC
ncbi:hypothetical protein BDY19DRAFT_394592 [Irpex rosettiformis]|uniref:Uncharacterized protein n=1 Tax=Irpex rosettiformis TaxID=378272 RepID=A0ACB8TUV1_9APHY|nr:hypothetical protein BDY19DRAFT_394592 [Irpex rosettiformis]